MMDQNTLDEARKMMADMLKKRRIELNLTQENLAEKTGLHRKTITRLEAGFVWLGMKQYLLVCEALHLFPCLVEMESTDLIGKPCEKIGHQNQKRCLLRKP